MMVLAVKSKYALCHHCMGYFHESGNVCASYEIDVSCGIAAIAYALVVNGCHDVVQSFIHLLCSP